MTLVPASSVVHVRFATLVSGTPLTLGPAVMSGATPSTATSETPPQSASPARSRVSVGEATAATVGVALGENAETVSSADEPLPRSAAPVGGDPATRKSVGSMEESGSEKFATTVVVLVVRALVRLGCVRSCVAWSAVGLRT